MEILTVEEFFQREIKSRTEIGLGVNISDLSVQIPEPVSETYYDLLSAILQLSEVMNIDYMDMDLCGSQIPDKERMELDEIPWYMNASGFRAFLKDESSIIHLQRYRTKRHPCIHYGEVQVGKYKHEPVRSELKRISFGPNLISEIQSYLNSPEG